MSKCAKCGKELADGWKACPFCGAAVENTCAYCGKSLDPAWVTCPFCGKPVKKEEPKTPKTQTPKTAKPEKFTFEFSEDTAAISEAFDKQLKAQEEAKKPVQPKLPAGILSKEKAIENYNKASLTYYAEKGDADAQYYLGLIYQAREQNTSEALFWYEKAAMQGNAKAQVALGSIYEGIYGNEFKDVHKAIYWYEKAIAHCNQRDQKLIQESLAELKKRK